jgi:hypothetical protein
MAVKREIDISVTQCYDSHEYSCRISTRTCNQPYPRALTIDGIKFYHLAIDDDQLVASSL